jgi:hypothetical protein
MIGLCNDIVAGRETPGAALELEAGGFSRLVSALNGAA